MSFLAPLFLVGALAVDAPVIFHLIRRTSREKITFSSLMFLRPTPPRVTRSSRLENIFLLLLRCLVLCLLALGFARPFLNRAASRKQILISTRLLRQPLPRRALTVIACLPSSTTGRRCLKGTLARK